MSIVPLHIPINEIDRYFYNRKEKMVNYDRQRNLISRRLPRTDETDTRQKYLSPNLRLAVWSAFQKQPVCEMGFYNSFRAALGALQACVQRQRGNRAFRARYVHRETDDEQPRYVAVQSCVGQSEPTYWLS